MSFAWYDRQAPITCALVSASIAAQDAPTAASSLGKEVFAERRACHRIGGGILDATDTELNNLIGRHRIALPHTNHQEATFAGLPKQSDIDDVTAYLKTFAPDGKKVP